MWPHLWRFLGRVWAEVLSWHSATTFSLVRETLLIPSIVLLVGWFALRKTIGEGWYKPSVLKTHGGDVLKSFFITVFVLSAMLGVVFLVAVPFVVYQDHIDLVSSKRDLVSANGKLVKERDDWKSKTQEVPRTIVEASPARSLNQARRLSNIQIQGLAAELTEQPNRCAIILAPQVLEQKDREERAAYGADIARAFTQAKWAALFDGKGRQPTTDYDGLLLIGAGSEDDLQIATNAFDTAQIVYKPQLSQPDGILWMTDYTKGSADFQRVAKEKMYNCLRIYIGKR